MQKPLLLLLILGASVSWTYAQTLNTITYTADTSVILNPERGFYHHEQTHSEPIDENNTGSYQFLSGYALDDYKETGTSLILRLFYLHEFYDDDAVSQQYIDNMQTDFNMLRSKGVKAVIRFAYTTEISKKDLGVTVSRVLSHLESLKEVLQNNQDVIFAAQIGFIGTYGEGYYTTNFGDGGQINDSQWEMRSQVVHAWLNTLPASIPLLIRTPKQKAKYLQYIGESTNAVTEAEAFNPAIAKARIGHQNDCILSSPDQLTYEFKIPRSSLAGLGSTIKLGYRVLENGSLVFNNTDAQLPGPSSDLAPYVFGTNTVVSQTPDWGTIDDLVDYANGTLFEFKAGDDSNYLYVKVRMGGYVQQAKDKYQLFINTDNNTATGWIDASAWTTSGANHVIENGVLKVHSLSGNGFTFSTVSALLPDSTYGPSFDDQGTFTQESDIDFLAEDSRYVVNGGETCALTSQSQCTPFLARMALHHYTFLNEIFHGDVLDLWETSGCYSDFVKKLGYRIRLTSANVQSSVEVGKRLYVSLHAVNDGFAAPAKLRKLNLVLKNTSTNVVYTIPFQSPSADVRKWLTGTITVNEALEIPADLPVGTYSLALGLPDAVSGLSTRPEYAIRFANTNMWDATNGVNSLNTTITVTSATSPSTPTIVVDGATSDWSNVDHIGLTGTSSSIKVLKAYDDATNLYLLATGSLDTNY